MKQANHIFLILLSVLFTSCSNPPNGLVLENGIEFEFHILGAPDGPMVPISYTVKREGKEEFRSSRSQAKFYSENPEQLKLKEIILEEDGLIGIFGEGYPQKILIVYDMKNKRGYADRDIPKDMLDKFKTD